MAIGCVPLLLIMSSMMVLSSCNTDSLAMDRSCPIEVNDNISKVILAEILRDYDKNVVPSHKGVDVLIDLMLQSIAEISELYASFTADLLFSEIWVDEGLQFASLTSCVPNLTLGYQMVDRIWLPTVRSLRLTLSHNYSQI